MDQLGFFLSPFSVCMFSFFLFPLSVFFSPAQERARGKSNLVRPPVSGSFPTGPFSVERQIRHNRSPKIKKNRSVRRSRNGGLNLEGGYVLSEALPFQGQMSPKVRLAFSASLQTPGQIFFSPLAVTDSSHNLGVAGRFFSPLEEFQQQEAT